MPEQEISSHQESTNVEHQVDDPAVLRAEFEQNIASIRRMATVLYEEAERTQRLPVDLIFEQESSAEDSSFVYGNQRYQSLVRAVRELKFSNKEEFINGVLESFTPLLYDAVYNSEVRKRIDEVESRHKLEVVELGKLEASIHPSNWEFVLSDSTKITIHDNVLDISWPEESVGPRGLEDVRTAFRKVVDILKQRDDIKAVIGVSWMMSHPITERLGFEKFPDIEVGAQSRASVVSIARVARENKNYERDVSGQDVMLGAMSRQQFINKYGESV
ncbi:MAG: hypothetical protein HY974_01515 [Candidatus Kerfeldbacteria bacterium]|nr:hypothetical protein [Candidatus Kerfeldbacteria bacterium]